MKASSLVVSFCQVSGLQEYYYKLLQMKEMVYEVRCLKSNEDMILALAGQFKQ